MARKKYSDIIVERLRELGWEMVSQPTRNMFYLNSGWRSCGTCCWEARIRRADEPPESTGHALTSQFTMKEVAKAAKWNLEWYNPYHSYVLDLAWEDTDKR